MKQVIVWIRDFVKRQRTRVSKKRIDGAVIRANEIFQITEYDGQLWFTHNGCLFCPCNMLVGSETQFDYVTFITKIREMYVERNK